MAFLSQSFAVDELPQGSGGNFEPLPAGWYQATITSAELKKTKAGTGEYIAIRYDILGPTHQGRVVFGNLNIANPNQKAEEIGRQQLRELMVSIGLNSVSDTDQLIGGSLSIKLDVKSDEQYGDKNEVRGFKSAGGGSAAPKAAASVPSFAAHAAAPAAPATAKAAPPWLKK
jgi:hypothetical protein